MDIFTLDDLLRREFIIDYHESMIWTERYKAHGDFQMVIRSDRGTRSLLVPGKRLAIKESTRVMTVETVENSRNDDGVATLTVTGRSLEVTLADRVATPNMLGSVATPKWAISGLPAEIAEEIFQTICVDTVNSPNDEIPFYTPGSIYEPGTIPEPEDVVDLLLDIDSVYNTIARICDVYDLGFRLVRNGDRSELYFDIYTGDDRTTLQTVFPAVIFAPSLDNLTDTTELTSTASLKNVAYVIAPNGSAYVYANGYDSSSAVGFNRKAIVIMADDIDLVAGPDLQAALQQRGREVLSDYKVAIAFDGEIPQFGSYIYGEHYDLGDLVETRNSDGLANNMRVVEQIFSDDQTGKRSYPTLQSELLITPGSWYAWDAGQVWDDAEGTWDEA